MVLTLPINIFIFLEIRIVTNSFWRAALPLPEGRNKLAHLPHNCSHVCFFSRIPPSFIYSQLF